MAGEAAVEAEGLRKSYGEVAALRGVDLLVDVLQTCIAAPRAHPGLGEWCDRIRPTVAGMPDERRAKNEPGLVVSSRGALEAELS